MAEGRLKSGRAFAVLEPDAVDIEAILVDLTGDSGPLLKGVEDGEQLHAQSARDAFAGKSGIRFHGGSRYSSPRLFKLSFLFLDMRSELSGGSWLGVGEAGRGKSQRG